MAKKNGKSINTNDSAVESYMKKFDDTVGAVRLEMTNFFKEGIAKSGGPCRKYLQELKKLAQELRLMVQEKRIQMRGNK